LQVHPRIYAQESAAVVVFISADYAGGEWTRLERRAALALRLLRGQQPQWRLWHPIDPLPRRLHPRLLPLRQGAPAGLPRRVRPVRTGNGKPVTGELLGAAIELALAGRPVPEPHRPSMGCSIKWRP
jgi:hypothetical protein